MKKSIFLILGLLSTLPLFAAGQDTVNMVTFFPVPYISYNNVYVKERLDVGLGNTCNLTVGDSSNTCGLIVWDKLRLDGTLEIQSTIQTFWSKTATIGYGEGAAATVRTQDLYVDQFPYVQSASSASLRVPSDKVYLFPSKFANPSDSTSVVTGCSEGVSWKKLKLSGQPDRVYLVCGNVEETNECTCDGNPIGYTHTTTCSSGGTGHILWTCVKNGNTCSWMKNSYCSFWFVNNSNYLYYAPSLPGPNDPRMYCDYYFGQAHTVYTSQPTGSCHAGQKAYVYNGSYPNGSQLTCVYIEYLCRES